MKGQTGGAESPGRKSRGVDLEFSTLGCRQVGSPESPPAHAESLREPVPHLVVAAIRLGSRSQQCLDLAEAVGQSGVTHETLLRDHHSKLRGLLHPLMKTTSVG